MRTIVGELPVESGTIQLAPRDATIGWLPQVVPDPAESLLAYARRRTGVAAADRRLEDASAALAEGDPGADEEYAAALERWLALGAADLEDRAAPGRRPRWGWTSTRTGRSAASPAARRPGPRWWRCC